MPQQRCSGPWHPVEGVEPLSALAGVLRIPISLWASLLVAGLFAWLSLLAAVKAEQKVDDDRAI
jgi:hypothetical protein